MRTEAPLLAPIFRSDGQARLLAAILLGDFELSISEVADRAGLAYATAHREIDRLVTSGILSERTVGRSRLISPNPASPITAPLRDILLVATGPVVLLAEALRPLEGIESAFLYGSFAARVRGVPGPPPNDIDLMVIGRPDLVRVLNAYDAVEALVRRPINATFLTREEFAENTGFLKSIRENPVIRVVGELPWR